MHNVCSIVNVTAYAKKNTQEVEKEKRKRLSAYAYYVSGTQREFLIICGRKRTQHTQYDII